MNAALEVLLPILGTLAGIAIGVVAAFYGTYYGCVWIDYYRGKSGGDGIVTVGCLFLVITVPTGAFAGGKIGFWIVRYYLMRD